MPACGVTHGEMFEVVRGAVFPTSAAAIASIHVLPGNLAVLRNFTDASVAPVRDIEVAGTLK